MLEQEKVQRVRLLTYIMPLAAVMQRDTVYCSIIHSHKYDAELNPRGGHPRIWGFNDDTLYTPTICCTDVVYLERQ